MSKRGTTGKKGLACKGAEGVATLQPLEPKQKVEVIHSSYQIVQIGWQGVVQKPYLHGYAVTFNQYYKNPVTHKPVENQPLTCFFKREELKPI